LRHSVEWLKANKTLVDRTQLKCYMLSCYYYYCNCYYAGFADSPEAKVQNFADVQQRTRSVVLEWLPPQRPDVVRYRVELTFVDRLID